MSNLPDIYRRNICNNCLSLQNRNFTPEQLNEVIYWLQHQEEVPFGLRIHTVNFTRSNVKQEDLPSNLVGLFGRPLQIITDE